MTAAARDRLAHLDGLRGGAVAVVVAHHLWLRVLDPAGTGRLPHGLPTLAAAARAAVAAFIVLSGYSLMLPVARSPDGRLPGGVGRYARRRAVPVLPPYYVALAGSLAPLVPELWRRSADVSADVSAGSVLAHLLLVQNLSAAWARQVNGPLWTIATECQIYVAFPLVLLPAWRRAGPVATIAAAVGAGLVLGRLAPQAAPWYLGLFAMGMAAAAAVQRPGWSWAAGGLAAVAAAVSVWRPQDVPAFDCACGAAVAAGLAGPPWRGLRAVPLVRLGVVSYTLYLIHQPLITMADEAVTRGTHWTGVARGWGVVAVAAAAVAVATAAFHRRVERPFMPGRPGTLSAEAALAAVEPGV